jgi:ubiquinone/menaquinone biosynthesis C-methylase UbiE
MKEPDRSASAEFEDANVVAAYVHRPDYPAQLYHTLLDLMPAHRRVLDLGSGPGKIARALAPHVDEVLAVDPSAEMLRLGRSLPGGRHSNIRWIRAYAEDLPVDPEALDLAVAGAAIHWMDPRRLFPKLARVLAPGAPVVVVDGDAPTDAPWLSTYQRVIRTWVERLGGVWNGEAHRALVTAHAEWFNVDGEATFAAPVHQSLDDLIACQHSRATWSRTRMGELADAFDADLREALAPWSEGGVMTFEVTTRMTWGRPRAN